MSQIGEVKLGMKDIAPKAIVRVTVKGCRMYTFRLWLIKCWAVAARIIAPIKVKIEIEGEHEECQDH